MATFSTLFLTAAPPMTGGESNAAFIKIDGREALLKSVELFLNRDNVKQLQVCFLPEQLEEAKRKHASHLGLFGVKVISGGPKWMDQIAAAAGKISADCTHVIIHDAARPAVAYSDIDALMEAAESADAAVLTAPIRTALLELDEGGSAVAAAPSSRFVQLLTPMVVSKAKFEQMASSRQEMHPSAWKLVKGSAFNIRAGSAEPSVLKAMINLLPKPKVKAPASPFEEAQW